MPQGANPTVALISCGLGHTMRGIETWTEDMGAALAARGVAVTVYKGGGRVTRPHERVIPCLKRTSSLNNWLVRHFPRGGWRLGFGSPYRLEEMTFAWNILPELFLRQFDIIHTQDPQIADAIRRCGEIGLVRSRVILAHGTEEPASFLARFPYVQHLAPHHLHEVRAQGYDGKYWCAIGNCVDTERFHPGSEPGLRRSMNIPEDAFVVLSVAAIKRTHKRLDYPVQEVAQLRQGTGRDVYLVVVGGITPETEEIRRLGETLLADRVRFLVDQPRDRMPAIYRMSDVFVLCSLKEMMPIALLEALASGLPAIVHRYSVMEWMIGSGGHAADFSVTGGLADVIPRYIDQAYREGKARLAREQAVQQFSREVIVEQIVSMYEKVLVCP